jgi:hypothetical protein
MENHSVSHQKSLPAVSAHVMACNPAPRGQASLLIFSLGAGVSRHFQSSSTSLHPGKGLQNYLFYNLLELSVLASSDRLP